jgi:hypothetical protein
MNEQDFKKLLKSAKSIFSSSLRGDAAYLEGLQLICKAGLVKKPKGFFPKKCPICGRKINKIYRWFSWDNYDDWLGFKYYVCDAEDCDYEYSEWKDPK